MNIFSTAFAMEAIASERILAGGVCAKARNLLTREALDVWDIFDESMEHGLEHLVIDPIFLINLHRTIFNDINENIFRR